MSISIGIKEFEFPPWVIEIYDNMTPEDRERNTKANIYGICNKTNKGYEITPLISDLSNRVPVLLEAKDVAVALILADLHFPWAYLPGNSIKSYKCKHCNHEFDTPLKDPRCPKCHEWEWSKP
jgi:hypothetical protein